MNRYIRQSLSLLNTIRKKIGQQICDRLAARLIDCQRQVLDQRESPQPYSLEEREFQPNEITSTAKSNRNNNNRQHRNNQRKSKKAKWAEERRRQDLAYAEAKKRKDQRKADAQCELPENIMIEHLEDHRDGIGWSIAALANKRFYIRRTLKINDSNGDMFCEVDDQGEALLKAVKQLISEHDRSNKTNEDIL